jgi:hypothetical protein
MDDDEVLRAKVKIFDTVKNIKSDTLKKFDSHVAQALKDYPEPAAMDLTIVALIWSKKFLLTMYGVPLPLSTYGSG